MTWTRTSIWPTPVHQPLRFKEEELPSSMMIRPSANSSSLLNSPERNLKQLHLLISLYSLHCVLQVRLNAGTSHKPPLLHLAVRCPKMSDLPDYQETCHLVSLMRCIVMASQAWIEDRGHFIGEGFVFCMLFTISFIRQSNGFIRGISCVDEKSLLLTAPWMSPGS
jgi:hypothetical protein